MARRILVVEDEAPIREMVCFVLEQNGFQPVEAEDYDSAVNQLNEPWPDLILLDWMLPGGSGLQFIKLLKREAMTRDIPVVMLTARGEEEDRVRGLETGADDYITKPFSMEELVFRIEAILRRVRGKKSKESTLYRLGRFMFDTQKQLLTIGDKQTKLTTKENELLALLCCAHRNEILQRDFALKTIWIDDNYFNARSMDVYITKLRKHLRDDDQIEIINIHGKGYKLITPDED